MITATYFPNTITTTPYLVSSGAGKYTIKAISQNGVLLGNSSVGGTDYFNLSENSTIQLELTDSDELYAKATGTYASIYLLKVS